MFVGLLYFLLFPGGIQGGLLMQLSLSLRRSARREWVRVGVKESPRIVSVLRCPKIQLQLIASNTYICIHMLYVYLYNPISRFHGLFCFEGLHVKLPRLSESFTLKTN